MKAEDAAVMALEKLGATIKREFPYGRSGPAGHVIGAGWQDRDNGGVGDEAAALLEKLPHLRRLGLSETAVSDVGLARIASLGELEELYLDDTGITDTGLAHLHKFVHLHELSLSNTRVTGAGLESIASLPELYRLTLLDTELKDADVAHPSAVFPPDRS